jgi:hypothetical protein
MAETPYHKLTIEASEGGWIVSEAKMPKKVFFKWQWVINHLESRLVTKGYPEND